MLAALRPLLKVHNYALYSAVMTLPVLILLSFGQPVSPAILTWRLIETVTGPIITFIRGYLI